MATRRTHWNQIESGTGTSFTPCGAGIHRGAHTTSPPHVTRDRDKVTCVKCRAFLGMAS